MTSASCPDYAVARHKCTTPHFFTLFSTLSSDYIDRNPVANMRKPTRKVGEFFLKPEQWRELLGAISDRQFADIVAFMLFTGARPQESRVVEARHYDKAHNRLVFSRYESKGEKRQRVIYLNDTAQEIVERLIKRYPEGTIFRNREEKA